METIFTISLVVQVVIAVILISIILVQHGKGADAGAAFGSGASATVFGSRGSGNFFTKATTVLAILFLSNSLFLSYLSANIDRTQASLLADEPSVIMDEAKIGDEMKKVEEVLKSATGDETGQMNVTVEEVPVEPVPESTEAETTAPAEGEVPLEPMQQ